MWRRVLEVHGDTARLDDDDAREIAAYFRPNELSLCGTLLTDDGLKHIGRMSSLALLDISETKVTDSGLAHLTRLTNLEELFATDTAITPAAAKKLKVALPKCTIYVGTKQKPVFLR